MTSNLVRSRLLKGLILLACSVCLQSTRAEVPFERILNASEEPHNWLTYNGGYASQRYSLLKQITRRNVDKLELKWMLQNQVFGGRYF